MPLVRPTLATALSTVQGLIGDMRKAARETGSAAGLDHLVASLEALDGYCSRRNLEIEVALAGPLSSEETEKAAAAIAQGFPVDKLQRGLSEPTVVDVPGPPVDVRVYLRPIGFRVGLKAGTPRPPIFMLVAPRPTLSAEDMAGLERAFEDRPQVILVGQPEEPYFKELEGKSRAAAWATLKVDLAQPAEQINAAQGRFAPGTPLEPFPELYRAHSACMALDALTSVLTMVTDQQAKELKINKSVTQQKLSKFQQQAGPGAKAASPAADIVAEIKQRTQRQATEFERGAQERLMELLNQPTGSLARALDGMIEGLDHLDQEQKVTTVASRVPQDFQDQVNRTIRDRFFRHAAGDLVAMNDMFRMISQDVDRTLAAAGGYPLSAQFRYLTDDRVRRTLDMYATFQVAYKGEAPAKGFSEYLSSVRKYSMLLVMAASMFGMSSMVRQYREITVPVTIILVGWGTYSVYNNTKRGRLEILEKQLDDARTQMRTEVKRILTELQKAWGAFLTQYLKEQIEGTLSELEAGIKDFQARRGGAQDPEKDRLQRQMQALDAAEKKLTASAKGRETLVQSVQQVRSDLKGLTAGGPPKPGVPGAAGVARPGMPGGGLAAAPRPPVPAAPAQPAGPSLADAKAAAMAEAKAKLEAMKGGGAAPAAEAAPKAPSPMDALKAKMAAAKAGMGGTAAAAAAPAAPPAAASPTPAPAEAPAAAAAEPSPPAVAVPAATPISPAAAPAAAAPAPAVAAAKPSALEAYKAKMAAMKAGGAKPAEAAAPAAPAATAEVPAPAAAAAATAEASPAAAPAAAAPASAGGKPSALEAYKAKMAAMKAAKEAGTPVAEAPAAAAPTPAPTPAAAAPAMAAAAAAEPPPAAEAPAAAAPTPAPAPAAAAPAMAAPAVVAPAAAAAEPAPAAEAPAVASPTPAPAPVAAAPAMAAPAVAAPAAAPPANPGDETQSIPPEAIAEAAEAKGSE